MNIKLPIKLAIIASWQNYKKNIGSIIIAQIISWFMLGALFAVGALLFLGFNTDPVSIIIFAIGLVGSILLFFGILLGWFRFMLDISDHKQPHWATLFSLIKKGYQLLLFGIIVFIAVGTIAVMSYSYYYLLSMKPELPEMGPVQVIFFGPKVLAKMLLLLIGVKISMDFELVTVGTIMFAIIGLMNYLMARLFWYNLLIVDRAQGIINAAKTSFGLTRGITWRLLGLIYAIFLIIKIQGIISFANLGLNTIITTNILMFMIMVFIFVPLCGLSYCYLYRWRINHKSS